MKKQILSIFTIFLLTVNIHSQTINFNVPKYSGSDYTFIIYQGQNSDTIQTGTVPEEGKITVTIPEKYKGYEGLCTWTLSKGGGLQFIATPDGLTISTNDGAPSTSSILYTNSSETDSLNSLQKEQNILFTKIENYFRTKQSYSDNQPLLAILDKEYPALQQQYEAYQKKLRSSNQYASFYILMTNYLKGIESKIYLPDQQQEAKEELIHYITSEIDMSRLYTSGAWNNFISMTFNIFPEEKNFGIAMTKILTRTKDQRIYELLSSDLMMICSQFGWDDAQTIIVDYLEQSGRIKEPTGHIQHAFMLNKTKTGSKAPSLKGVGSVSSSVLIFYESGCEHCREQLDTLVARYDLLKSQGIRVISISSDTSDEVFKYHSAKYPWKNKLCDRQGFKGENFLRYGVFSTPTIYYTDKNSLIVDRKARLQDIKALQPIIYQAKTHN
ncbi:MAG: thioredoxin family protein [Dysgonamonadaceae bacterium]|jgi:hypothetical protein|nr:thioredoxin family protein [Dysgonamonadaceae bacterium]